MNKEMTIGEQLERVTRLEQTRKILDILKSCKEQGNTLDEAVKKVEALLGQ